MGQEVMSGAFRHVQGQLNVLNLAAVRQGSYAVTVMDEQGNRWTEWMQIK
jgi:hypothetical protein